MGSDRTINMIMLGAFVAKTGITSLKAIMSALEEIVKGKKPGIMKMK